MNTHIEQIPASDIHIILPLIQKLNPGTALEILKKRLDTMKMHGYHCAGFYLEKKLIGISGFWIGGKFYCGKYMELDNVFIDEKYRSSGYGDLLVNWLEKHARTLGCETIMLDAYVSNTRAHKFYIQRNYEIIGYHFSKEL